MGFRIFGDKSLSSQKKHSLEELKHITEKEKQKDFESKIRDIVRLEMENAGIMKEIERLSGSLSELNRKISEMNSSLLPLNRMKEDSIRKLKMKRLVLEKLRKSRRLSANDLSGMLNLSRTRCSEYLSELERSGLAKGMMVSKQKFFEICGNKK